MVFLDFVKVFLISTPSFQIFGNQLARKGALIMPKKKALDTAKLIEMVKAETSSAEIMKKMGFQDLHPAEGSLHERSDR